MVFRGDISEKAVGLAIFKKKSEVYVGPRPMGLRFETDFLRQWSQISTKYLSCAQSMMVLEGDINEKAVGLAISKKNSDPWVSTHV